MIRMSVAFLSDAAAATVSASARLSVVSTLLR
jgi:hypothetical protein